MIQERERLKQEARILFQFLNLLIYAKKFTKIIFGYCYKLVGNMWLYIE